MTIWTNLKNRTWALWRNRSAAQKVERDNWQQKQASFGWSDTYTKVVDADGKHVKLGRGHEGTVRLAQTSTGDLVAIKKRRNSGRAQREFSALAKIKSDQVPKALAYASTKKSAYLVMQWVPGTRPNIGHPADIDAARQCTVDLLAALCACHKADVIHFDFGRGNVLVDEGRAYLIDLGITLPRRRGFERIALWNFRRALSLFTLPPMEKARCLAFLSDYYRQNRRTPRIEDLERENIFPGVLWPLTAGGDHRQP